jgi:hypothetical protein
MALQELLRAFPESSGAAANTYHMTTHVPKMQPCIYKHALLVHVLDLLKHHLLQQLVLLDPATAPGASSSCTPHELQLWQNAGDVRHLQ